MTARDGVAFEEALRGLLAATAAETHAMADPTRRSILASNYPFAPNRWLSVEGLAWLALAERAGLATDYELEGCHRAVRTASDLACAPAPTPTGTWPNRASPGRAAPATPGERLAPGLPPVSCR